MSIEGDKRWIRGIGFVVVFLWAVTVSAQTYNSGSTGADGAFAPAADTTLALPPGGVFNFTTVNIPAGVTVTFTPNAANTPVTILATGEVNIGGVISVNGSNGLGASSTGLIVNPGRAGGPGGFSGGPGGARGATNRNGTNSQGPGGGTPGKNGSYGAPAGFGSLIPLFGGSGGGGGNAPSGRSGASGGGGGDGSIPPNTFTCLERGGGGSGGAIRLVAPEITGTGTLVAIDGRFGCFSFTTQGIIRLEAFNLNYTGASSPLFLTSISPGPVTAASTPPLINLPTLTISTVGGVASPANPGGSLTSADISLPATAINPIPVTLTATNTPVGTVFTVRLIPQFAPKVDVASVPSTGTFSSSTATANITFPVGQVSILNAFASFTLPAQTASLYPLIDGEPVERIMIAAHYGAPSTVTLITKSGKKVKADQLLKGGR